MPSIPLKEIIERTINGLDVWAAAYHAWDRLSGTHFSGRV